MENVEQKQFYRMIETPVNKLILSLAIPTTVSMMVTSIYNMADTFFVSKLGTSASGAVGIVFSLMALIQTVGFAIGHGSGSIVSRLLGKKESDKAQIVCNSGFIVSLFLGTLVAIAGSIWIHPLMRLLGSTETILPYAVEYGKYIIYAAPVMIGAFVLNNLLRAEGKAKFSMIGIATGGILNIFLDPIFIFTFHLGIGGAAIATALSQFVSFIILLSAYFSGKTVLKLKLSKVSMKMTVYTEILVNGLPSLFRQGLASISTVALNFNAAIYGDAAVAALSIVGKIFMFIFSIMIGFGQGYQPVSGYNYGARNYGRVKEAFFFMLKISLAAMILLGILGFVNAPFLMTLFIKDDPAVIAIGANALRAQCLALPLVPFGIVCNMTFQAVGKPLWSTITSSARQGFFFIPLVLILPKFLGITGLQIAQALSDLITFIFVIPFIILFFKDLKYKKDNNL